MRRASCSSYRQKSIILPSFRSALARRLLSCTTLIAFTAVFVVPRSALQAARPAPELEAPAPVRPGEVTFGIGVSDQEVSASLDTLFPLAVPKNGLLFLNPKLSGGDELDPRVSIGLGYRHLFEHSNVIVGGNIFYDCFDSVHDHRMNQLGIGAEVLTRWVDFRANYYLPEQNRRTIGHTETVSLSRKSTSSTQELGPRVTGQDLAFQGNNIIETISGQNDTLHTINLRETETRRFWERYEAGMRGGDAEVGFLIPGLDRYADVRVFGGYYFYENQFGKDINGFKGRLEVRALPAVTFDAMYYEDKEVIGSNWFYGVRVSAPFDLANLSSGRNPFAGLGESFKPKNHEDDKAAFASRMTENIIRSSRVSTSESKFVKVREEKQTYKGKSTYITSIPFSTTEILTLNGAPITVTHASSLVGGPGNGTFETPYSSLTLANADAVKRDIVLLHANSTFTLQSITLVPGQQLLGDYASVSHLINSDQGLLELPHATAGTNAPTVSNVGGTVVNVVNNSVVSGLNLTGGARGLFAAGGASGVKVTNSTISNMTTAGIEIKPSTGTTITNVNFNNNATDVILNAFNTTITNVTSNGATNGAFDLSNTTGTTTITNVTVNNAGNFAFRFTNPGGTHNIKNLDITGGTGVGVLVVGGGGTFNFDKNTSINNTGGAAFTLQGGTANVSYLGTMTENNNVPLVAVLAGHTGTATFQTGTLNATNGQGLLFDNADGTYNFLGATTLHGGDAGVDIVNGSDGTFTFAAGTAITNPTGQGFFVNGGTANVSYAGSIAANASAAVEVLNHTTGTISFIAGSSINATGGTGLQFTNDGGTYNFLGAATLNGGDAGIDILTSNGTFAFGAGTNITNPSGTGFFLNGGQAKVTYSGNITDNTGFALQVINHSVGTVAFNTGTVTSTAGLGVQFVNDSGTYSIAKTSVSNSTGAGVEVTASPTGTFTFNNVVITSTTGPGVQLNNAGTVNVLGGSINGTGGNGLFSQNTALTATGLLIGNNHALNITGIGIQVINNDGTARVVTVSNDNIRSKGSAIVTTDSGVAGELTLILNGNTLESLNAGSKAMNIAGSALNSTTVRSMNGGTVIGNGTGGGLLFNRVTFDGDAAAGVQQVTGGLWNIGQSASARVFNDALHYDAPTGTLAFTTLNIFNNAGTGLFVDTKTLGTTFTLNNTGGVINTTAGAGMNVDPLTIHLTFASVTSTGSGTSGIIVDGLTAGSTLTIGASTVSTSTGDGIVVRNSAGSTLNFGATTVTNVGGDGIDLTAAGNANVIFGTTNINGFSTTGSGVNFAGSDVTATFGKTTIQNAGNGTGIDLSSTQNGRVITFLTGSSITNVAIGVQLSSSGTTATTANSNFRFGDGSGTDANGRNSIINAPTTVAAIGLNPASGTYNFQDVFFTGTAAFPASSGAFFVKNQAVTGGDGSFTNPFGVQEADAITTTGITFAFLDGTYNFNTLNAGLAFTLSSGQALTGLDNGNSVTFGTVQPANISGNFGVLGGTVTRANTGNGTLSITNGAAASVFDLRGGNTVSNITLTGEGGAIDPTSLFLSNGGSGGFNNTGGITLSGVTISNLQAGSTALSFTNMTGNVQVSGNNINASGGTLLGVNGGTATYTLTKGSGTLTGKAIDIRNTTGGSVAVTGASLGTNGNTAVTLNGNAATVTLTNVAVTRTAGDTAYAIDATAASTGKVTINGTSSIDSTAGIAFVIRAGARDIDASAVNFNNAGTTAGNVIVSTGQTGGTIKFGNVGITGYNGGGAAVNLQGSGGTVTFGDLDVTTTNGEGVDVGQITFAPGSSATINATGLPALTMASTTLSGGAATFASITGSGTAFGISLNGVIGATTFTTVAISTTFFEGIRLNNSGAVAINGGTINGTTGDGILSVNTDLTVSGVTMGGTAAIGGDGIDLANTSGAHTVAINNTTITNATGAGFKVSHTGGGTTTITSLNGNTITKAGAGGILIDTVTFDSDTATAGIQQVAGGNTTIGSLVTTTNVTGNGLRLNNVLGSLAFGTLNIGNDTGTGLFIRDAGGKAGSFAFGATGGAVNTTNGTALDIDPVAFNVTFSSVGSTNSTGNGINLDTISGTANLGNVSVTNATGAGLRLVGSSATVTAGTVTVNGAATGLLFGTNTGSFTATGATSLTNITGTGINANAATGTYSFKGLTIGFSGAGRGIDFRGSNVQFETDTISITGNGTAGSIAIDLSGTLNPNGANSATPNILLAKDATETASISNVAVGVKMGEAGNSAGAYFRYGNQTPLNSGSSIAVIAGGTTLDTTNLTSTNGFTQGRYEFKGVAFTGSASFEASPNFFFVAANATGTGDGSTTANRANASTLVTSLNGNLLANKTIVLINDGNVISLGNNTATLNSLTNVDGFGNGNSVSAFNIPVNVIVDTFSGTVGDPTGNGAATITANSGNNVITLTGTHSIKNINITGGDFLVAGNGFTGLTVQGVGLSGAGTGVFSFTNATGVTTLTNNTISQAGGRLLDINGGTAGVSLTAGTGSISNTGGSGVQVRNTTGGSVTLTGVSVTGATATPLTFDNNQATFAITGSTFAVNAGVTLLNVDTGTGGSTTALTFNNSNTLTQTAGTIAIIGAGSRSIDLSAHNFTNTGTTAANVISSTGQTGGTISFGNVGITGYNNAAGTAVSLAGSAGTVSFADLDVTTTAGAGVNVGGITFAPGSSATINAGGANALTLTGTTLSGGAATFSSVTSSGGTNGIALANVTGATTFTTVAISGSTGDGISLSTSGPVAVNGGTINGTTADGIHSVNTNLTVSGVTMGGTTAIGGDGIDVVNTSGARTVAINNTTVTNATGAGFRVSHTGGGTTSITSLNGNTITKAGAGGILVDTVTFDSDTATAGIQQVAGGNTTIGSLVTTTNVTGNGLRLNNVLGDIAFGTLNIGNDTGTGLFIRDAGGKGGTFAFGATGGAVNTTNGTALDIDPVAFNVTFSSVGSTNAATNGINLDTISGTANLGNVSVTNATGAGLRLVGSSATVTAGTVTVNGAATGLILGNNTGSFTATGATSLTNITGTGINANAATGTYSFQGVTIGFSGAGRGIDFRSSNLASFQTGSITITGNGTAGSIALDLSGSVYPGGQPVTNNAPNIKLATGAGQTAAISNVATGVKLGESPGVGSAGAYLRYGNQTPVNSGSTIAVIGGGFTIDTTNLTSTTAFQQGRYEFLGVAFTGSASFQASTTFFFVASTATGDFSGSSVSNRANGAGLLTALGANQLANQTIVLINDGSAITIANTANLDANTNIDGFGNGNSVAAFTIPVNVIIDTFGGTVADPTGNGAATLTTAGGHNLVSLNGTNSIKNVSLSGGDFLVGGTGITGLTVQGTTLTSGATGVFSITNPTGTITITNNTISGAGRLLTLNGGSAAVSLTKGTGTVANTGGSGVNISNTTAGSVTLTGLSVTGATATPLTFDNNKATFAITGSTFAVNAGVTLLNVDTNAGGSTTALTFDNSNTLTQTSGTIATIGAGLRNIDLSAFNFTNSGTTAANVIKSVGQTGGTISFGNIGITGYNNAAGTAVSLAGTSGTVSFADLDIATTAGAGLNVGAITFTPGGSSTISATGANAVTMSGTTTSGTATFSSVTSTGGTNGISLTNVTGSTGFTTVSISGSGADGISLSGAGTVNVNGGTVNGTTGDGVHSANTAVGVLNVTFGGVSAIGGDAIEIINSDSTARTVSAGLNTMTSVTGRGIFINSSGSGALTASVSLNNITSAGNALETADGGTAGSLLIGLNNNTYQATGAGGLGVKLVGSGLNSTIVTAMGTGTVTANGTGGGVLFNRVTFDNDGNTGNGIQQVAAGVWGIGQGTGAAQRVQGDGLTFLAPTGSVSFGTLTIFNNNGTGLKVDTKTAPGPTTFTLAGGNVGSVNTTGGAALNLDPFTSGLNFGSVTSTGSATSGVILDTVSGTLGLGAVNITLASSATGAGLKMTGSSAVVTASSLTVVGSLASANGLQFGANTGGSFTVSGATSVTGIATTAAGVAALNANGATGTYAFTGGLTIGFSGNGRGLDLRGSNVTSFTAGTTSITGAGTAGSIAIDLSGSLFPPGQPVSGTPNIQLGTGGAQTATISNVATGVKLGDGTVGSAHSYFRYGNQGAANGSNIDVTAGGFTIDTTNLTTTTAFQEGRYEFVGVTYGSGDKASFEVGSANFIFVSAAGTGSGSGGSPTNAMSIANFLATQNTAVNLASKSVVFVNDGASINVAATTLNLGANTSLLGFGNSATVIVPGGTVPLNVIGTFTPGGGSFTDPIGGAATVISSTSTVTLNTGNTLSNFILGNATTAITGTNFGTLTINGMVINTNGGAVNLNTGTLAGTGFNSVTSTGGTNAINLNTVAGTMNFGSGALSGATGVAFNVSGGTVTSTYSGNITQLNTNTTNALVSVTNHATGTITFQTGTLSAGTGNGLSFNNADGTYNFNGTTTLNGGNARAEISTGSSGTFTFGSGASITQTTQIAFAVDSSSANVTYNGTITQNGAANAVFFFNNSGGTTAFNGLVSATTGAAAGVSALLNTASSTLNFTGGLAITTTTGNGISFLGAGNMSVSGAGNTVNTASGTAFVNSGTGGSAIIDINSALTTTTGRLIDIQNRAQNNALTLSGNLSNSGTGILVQNNSAGAITFSGATKTLSTGINQAVTLTTNAGATINFTGGGLAITTSSGLGFGASGGGTINIAGSGNTVTTATGQILNWNGVSIGTGVTFATLQSTGILTTTAISLNDVDSFGTFAGGNVTIAATTGATSDGIAITGGSSAFFTFASATIGTTAGTIGRHGINLDGSNGPVTFTTVDIDGTVGSAVRVNANTASVTINGGTIGATADAGNATNAAFAVSASSSNITYSGTISNSTGRMITVTDTIGATVFFNTATANGLFDGAGGSGILIDGAAGNVQVNNADLNGTRGIEILGDAANNATGVFTFNNVTIDTVAGATNHAFIVDGDQGTPGNNDVNAIIDLNNVDITNPGGQVVSIQGMNGGSVDFDAASTISRTNGGLGILATSNAGGAIRFNGATTTLTTGGNTAVDLTNNTGATIRFGNGGLAITTTTGTGFNATGGGTIEVVTGTNPNTITTTTGTAVNIANTTIGAGGITFDSVSTNGAANGILLDTVGNGAFTASAGSIVGATTRGVDVNGGSGNISIGASISTSGAASRSVEITGHTGGTVAFTGNITDTSTGLRLDSNTGGTYNFSAGTKTFNTGTNTAVTLSSNTGATINFTGGGLDIDTTSGTGFSATGGGTITVQGTVNTIDATSGAGLNVNATTIGALGMTFQRISSGAGAGNGISLVTTGSGFFTIAGTGVANSGGVISGKTGADGTNGTTGTGIYLNGVSGAVSLTRMSIEGNQNYGIRGITVSGGFTLDNSTVGVTTTNGTNDAADADGTTAVGGEASVRFTDITGTATFSNDTLDRGLSRTLNITNHSGTLALNVTNSTINQSLTSGAAGTNASDALFTDIVGTATLNATVTNSNFLAYRQFAIQSRALNTGTTNWTITGNKFANSNSANVSASGSISLGGSGLSGGDVFITFDIENNTFRHGADGSGTAPTNGGAHLVAGLVSGTGTAYGKFINNTVGVSGVVGSGAGNGADALRLFASGNNGSHGNTRYLVQGNTIQRYGEAGIQLNARQGNAGIDATIIGNIIREPGTAALGAFAAIWVNAGALPTDTNIVNIAIGGTGAGQKNTMQDSDPSNSTDVFLDSESDGGAVTKINLYRNGSTTVVGAGETLIRNILIEDNNATLDLGAGFTNGSNIGVFGGLPAQPPLLFAASSTPAATRSNAPLTQNSLNALGNAAISLWTTSGLTATQSALLQTVTFGIADLPAGYLGTVSGTQVLLSSTAAGNYWFIDSTPLNNSEFTGSGLTLQAITTGEAAGRVDALSVLLHEIGHTLGFPDGHGTGLGGPLMEGDLGLGQRFLPDPGSAIQLSAP